METMTNNGLGFNTYNLDLIAAASVLAEEDDLENPSQVSLCLNDFHMMMTLARLISEQEREYRISSFVESYFRAYQHRILWLKERLAESEEKRQGRLTEKSPAPSRKEVFLLGLAAGLAASIAYILIF